MGRCIYYGTLGQTHGGLGFMWTWALEQHPPSDSLYLLNETAYSDDLIYSIIIGCDNSKGHAL